MKVQDVKIGEYYRHKDTPNYAWAKPLEILKPNEKQNKGNKFIVIKCQWVVNKNDKFGMIKYFRPNNLIK